MTKTQIAAGIYTVLTACKRGQGTANKGVPNGHCYAQLMEHFDLEQWTKLIAAMKEGGMINETNHLLQITPPGEAILEKLEEVYAEAEGGAK